MPSTRSDVRRVVEPIPYDIIFDRRLHRGHGAGPAGQDGLRRRARCEDQRVHRAIENARLSREVERAGAEAELASRMKDEVLAMPGHELRNPLSSMVAALEVMMLRESAPASRECATPGRQVRHMVNLVADLLVADLSDIARGQVHMRQDDVDTRAVVAKAVETFLPLLVECKHTIDAQIPAGLVVRGDEVCLAQAY